VQVRIGVADAPRELELDVEDADAVAAKIEAALSSEDPAMVWIADVKGRRIGIPAARVAYFEIGAEHQASVGFGA
jgi:hypothetical protein